MCIRDRCSEDWARKGILGNIHKTSIKEIWLGDEIMDYRNKLASGLRSGKSPCKNCNINGCVYGEESFDVWT